MDFSNIEKIYDQRNGAINNKEDFMRYFKNTYLSQFRDETEVVWETMNNAFDKISERIDKDEFNKEKQCCLAIVFTDNMSDDFIESPCIHLSSTYFNYKLEGCELSRYWIASALRFESINPKKTFKVSLPTKPLQTITINEKDIEMMKQYVNHYNCLVSNNFFKDAWIVCQAISDLLGEKTNNGFIKLCQCINPNIIWTEARGISSNCFRTEAYFKGSEQGNYNLAKQEFNSESFNGFGILNQFIKTVQSIMLKQLPSKITDQIVEELIIDKIQKCPFDELYVIDFSICEDDRPSDNGASKNVLLKNGIEFRLDGNQLKISINEVPLYIYDTNIKLIFQINYEETHTVSKNLSKYVLDFYRQIQLHTFDILKYFFDFPKELQEILEEKGLVVHICNLSNSLDWLEVSVSIENPVQKRN